MNIIQWEKAILNIDEYSKLIENSFCPRTIFFSRKIYPYHIFMMVIYCILIDMYLYTIQITEVKDIIMLVNLKT